MFGDFHGFSKLSDRQMLLFYEHVMSRLAAVLDKYSGEIATRNTWGDGLFVVFSELGAAARCALEIQSALVELDYQSLGMPGTLGLRLGLDAGAVFEVQDPVLKSLSFTGTHISRTARLEPSTPPGEVYVTQAFAALFTLLEHDELICEYVGMMKAAKDYGRLRVYLLRRRVYSDLAPQDGV
jgi:class 3 adenylate cyclase